MARVGPTVSYAPSVNTGAEQASPVRRVLRTLEPIKHELAKFGIVGTLCYGLDSAIFFFMRLVTEQPYTPKIVAGVISMTAAFVGNRHWTWRNRPESALGREYIRFVSVNAVGLVLQLACLGLTHDILGSFWPVMQTKLADFLSQGVFGMALATTFRFWAYRRFVFQAHVTANSVEPLASQGTTSKEARGEA